MMALASHSEGLRHSRSTLRRPSSGIHISAGLSTSILSTLIGAPLLMSLTAFLSLCTLISSLQPGCPPFSSLELVFAQHQYHPPGLHDGLNLCPPDGLHLCPPDGLYCFPPDGLYCFPPDGLHCFPPDGHPLCPPASCPS